MSELTVGFMRELHVRGDWAGDKSRTEYENEFDRWLDKEHRDARAAAIRDAAAELLALDPIGDAVMWDGNGYERVYDWLLDRAKQIEKGDQS